MQLYRTSVEKKEMRREKGKGGREYLHSDYCIDEEEKDNEKSDIGKGLRERGERLKIKDHGMNKPGNSS